MIVDPKGDDYARYSGATVLTPTAEWTALRKEMLELNRKLK